MLHNPLIPSRIKSDMFVKLLKDEVGDLTIHFLCFVCEKRRTGLLPAMIHRFEEFVHSFKGIVTAEIISAQLLDDEQLIQIRDQLVEKLEKTIELKHSVNKNLVGGFVIRIKDTVVDLSVNGQLEKIKEKMVLGS
jgi:F-type H+-transporting ATPase subunit delta